MAKTKSRGNGRCETRDRQCLTFKPLGARRIEYMWAAQRAEDLAAVTAERDAPRAASQALVDVRNGPPLILYEDDWNAAMELARKALGVTS